VGVDDGLPAQRSAPAWMAAASLAVFLPRAELPDLCHSGRQAGCPLLQPRRRPVPGGAGRAPRLSPALLWRRNARHDGIGREDRLSKSTSRLRPARGFSGIVSTDGARVPRPAVPGTLDHWLTERYCLYATGSGRLYRAEIHHAPWRLQPVEFDTPARPFPGTARAIRRPATIPNRAALAKIGPG
jgi:Uncharacterized conserved protein (COG2071)